MNEHDPTTRDGQAPEPDPELHPGFYGFVATKPELRYYEGKPRLFFRAGQEHFDYAPDGSRIKLPTTFHTVVAFQGAAEHAGDKLHKRDWFLAHGRPEQRENPTTGQTETRFVANRIGHDGARMNYEVGTPRRTVDMEPAQREQQRNLAFEPPEQEQPEHEPHQRAM